MSSTTASCGKRSKSRRSSALATKKSTSRGTRAATSYLKAASCSGNRKVAKAKYPTNRSRPRMTSRIRNQRRLKIMAIGRGGGGA